MAIAVLSITILASTAVSATYLRSRISIKKYQANNEELSVALNSMSKDIRMSNGLSLTTTIGSSIKSISIRSNVTGNPIVYAFSGTSLTRTETISGSNVMTTIANGVTGNFYVFGNPAETIPRITISITKDGVPGMTVQTTVSMRSGYEPVP